MSREGQKTFTGYGRPNLQCVIVRPRYNPKRTRKIQSHATENLSKNIRTRGKDVSVAYLSLENWRQVMTWSSCPFRIFDGLKSRYLQFISTLCCLMKTCFHGSAFSVWGILGLCLVRWTRWAMALKAPTPASLHFSLHSKLSSARIRQYLQVWAAFNKSLGPRKDKTYKAN